ncbi:MAG TPA: class I SAM-dependent methyltransferase, partial [Polyangiaceae bacterium]|nr:class I SAM-dependent methyltransferase [Polyangiaceae bacterium]
MPDIEVEVSLDDPPPSVQAPPKSGPDQIGRLSAKAEADLAEALASGAYEPPPDDRPTTETPGEPEPESVEVSPESVEVDEGPEVVAGEARDEDDPFAEPEGEGAFGEPESVEAVEDLDATQEMMAALDVGAEDEPVEADEDELEEVDDAEVQSDPRGSAAARGPAAPYASSVRLSGPERGSTATPPTPPARGSRDEALDLRTNKRRARPWWEELFDDDFLRATPRPTDAQVAAEASFIEGRLGLAKGALILDLACGHGRHAIELTRRGYQVVGFDLSLAMLAYAADEAEVARQKVNFLHGDMREMPFEDKFDGIYCWGTSFGFFEEEKNFALLQRVHRALRPGGVFLLETINRDFITARQPS